ncbi:MAG TPA: hypothetical protein VMV32_04710 [Ignavibacteriaceae bacterium]|nr:hypothetical protein [Ignavibacteriaceae bacterium]
MGKPIQTLFKTQADLVTPMSLTLTPGTDGRDIEDNIQLLGCYFKAATAITETVTVTLVSAEGSGYSFLLDSTALSDGTTVVYSPTGFIGMKKGDVLTFACTSASATGMAGYMMIQYTEAA